MTSFPAARKGDKTDHEDTPLEDGPGASNTLINDKPAWRANADIKKCALDKPAPHVPEIATYGSYTVLIEGQMATRVNDHCLGSTFPATIVEGSPNVIIGDKLGGLAADIPGFCTSFCAMLDGFDELSEEEQRAAIETLVNEKLEALEIPGIDVVLSEGDLGAGSFSWWDWELEVAKGPLGLSGLLPAEKTELGKVILHETRHAEQSYRIAQHVANQPNADLASVMSTANVPQSVAEAALASPASTAAAEAWYESEYGSWSDYRAKTHNDLRAGNDGGWERYRALPEEHDAWDVDDLTNCVCKEKKKEGA